MNIATTATSAANERTFDALAVRVLVGVGTTVLVELKLGATDRLMDPVTDGVTDDVRDDVREALPVLLALTELVCDALTEDVSLLVAETLPVADRVLDALQHEEGGMRRKATKVR